MKIIQINSVCGHGSTGVIAVEIAQLLKRKGHECYIAYGQGSTDYPNSFKIGSTIENKLHALIFTRILGLQGYGNILGTRRLIRWIKSISPDVIQLHNLHGNYLNFPILFKFLAESNIPVVWALFDCWSFTGKCTHFTACGCRKWETLCKECPQLHKSFPHFQNLISSYVLNGLKTKSNALSSEDVQFTKFTIGLTPQNLHQSKTKLHTRNMDLIHKRKY